jgi:hypothetical protein
LFQNGSRAASKKDQLKQLKIMAITAAEKITDVCNLALSKLGQYQIVNIDHDRNEAVLCRLHLPYAREQLLRSHPWNFATKFAELVKNETLFDVRWPYRYTLPCDYLQLISAWHDKDQCFRIDKFNVVQCDLLLADEFAFIEYTSNMLDARIWDANFIDCVATLLASKLAVPITGSVNIQNALLDQLYNVCIPQAHLNNAWEDASNENNSTEERMNRSSLIQKNNYYI